MQYVRFLKGINNGSDLISQKASKNYQIEKSSNSESETISVSSKATIVENRVNDFDIKNCTPKAIYN
jgi:hypothetical protein